MKKTAKAEIILERYVEKFLKDYDIKAKHIMVIEDMDKVKEISGLQSKNKKPYNNDTVDKLLQFYLQTKSCIIGKVIENGQALKEAIKSADWKSDQYFFPIRVDAITGEFIIKEKLSKNLIGIRISKNDKKQIMVDYIDPSGQEISEHLKLLLQQQFPKCKLIEYFNQNNKIRYGEKNAYDCGPFLIYSFKALQDEVMLPIINDAKGSVELGQYLRQCFEEHNQIDFRKLSKHPERKVEGDKGNYSKDIDYNELKLKVKNIIESKNLAPELKFNQLTEINKKEYSQLLNALKNAKTIQELIQLANYLNDTAVLNMALGELNTDPKYYTDGATNCLYAITILNKHLPKLKDYIITQKILELKKSSFKNLSKIEQLIIQTAGGNQNKVEIINEKNIDKLTSKKLLTTLRDKVKKELRSIEENKINNNSESKDKIPELFKMIASRMKDYLEYLHIESEEILGIPPCQYTVIGLGSMALGQMTPYSDLEFAILTENELYKQSEDQKIQNYFKNLSHYVNFKVICLGETTIPGNYYNVNLDHFVKPAVNLDLGGKTPLGRSDKPYELISTVEKMFAYMRNEGEKTEHIDKNLPYILENVCFVCGSDSLFKEYSIKVKIFLNTPSEIDDRLTYGKIRAIKMLLDGCVEIDYKDQSRKEYKTIGNIEQFVFNPNKTKDTIFNIKQEIYRLPDRFIYNLGLIYGIKGEDSWDTIDLLNKSNILSHTAANNLKNALSFATNLRLKIYSYYGYQKEAMKYEKYEVSNHKKTEELLEKDITETFRLSEKDLQENGDFFKFYYTTIPLTNKLYAFCKRHEDEILTFEKSVQFFNKELFYQNDFNINFQINIRLSRDEEALKYLKLELKKLKTLYGDDYLQNVECFNNMGYIYGKLGEFSKQLHYNLKALNLLQEKKVHDKVHDSKMINTLFNIGNSYLSLGKLDESKKYLLKALVLYEATPKPNHFCDKLSYIFNNIGIVCLDLGNPNKGLKYLFQSLEIGSKSLDKNSPGIISTLINIGKAYDNLKDYNKALEYQEKVLPLFRDLYELNHPFIVAALNNIGTTYGNLKNHNKALKYKWEAFELCKKDTMVKGIILDSIGMTYGELGKNEYALELQLKALNLQQQLFQDHPEIVTSMHNIGGTYRKLENHEKALEYYLKALQMQEKLFKLTHIVFFKIYNDIGDILCQRNLYDEALKYFEKALCIIQNQPEHNYLELVSILWNIGITHSWCGNNKISIEYYEKALNIAKKFLPENNIYTSMIYKKLEEEYDKDSKIVELSSNKNQKLSQTISNNINFSESEEYDESEESEEYDESEEFDEYEESSELEMQNLFENEELANTIEPIKAQLLNHIEQKIENRIKEAFKKQNLSGNCDAEIEINISGVDKEDLKSYCKSQMHIRGDDLTFDGNLCSITFDIIAIKIMRQKIEQNLSSNALSVHEFESYWYSYTKLAMEQLLQLRLEHEKLKNLEILMPKIAFDEDKKSTNFIAHQIGIKLKENSHQLLVSLNMYNKHWVGLVIEKHNDLGKVTINYMDSEQNPIPVSLKQSLQKLIEDFTGYKIVIKETVLEVQKYNNCGPETIENIIAYFTGERFSQEDAVEFHSLLLEQFLLGSIEESNMLLDSYF